MKLDRMLSNQRQIALGVPKEGTSMEVWFTLTLGVWLTLTLGGVVHTDPRGV